MSRLSSQVLPVASAILLILSGCGGGGGGEGGGVSADGNGGTCVIGVETDADALSPFASSTVTGSDIHGILFETLARTNPDMATYSPELAESWDFSSDHRSLTFRLRRNATWHDGAPVTAYDVEFSLPLYKNPKIAYGAVRWLDHVVDAVALDSFTVRFDFDAVYPYQLTDANVAVPLPKHLLEGIPAEELLHHPFNRSPVGNGPFLLENWTPQQTIVLRAYENHYDGRPPLDRLVFKIVPDRTSLLAQLKTGAVDLYPKFPPHAYEELRKTTGIVIHRVPSRSYYYLGWNNAHSLFEDRRVRRALTMAIDREQIVRSLLFGLGRVIHGPILPFLWAHDPEIPPIPYDPERAKSLLAEAGWEDHDGDGWLDKDGVPFEFTMKTNENNDLRKDIVVVVQEMLAKIGVRMHPEAVEWTVFVEQTNRKEFEADCYGWRQAVKVDLTPIWHSRAILDKFNQVSYSNAEVDDLIDRAGMELDRERAKRLWSRAQRLIAADAPYTFLFNLEDVHAVHERFRNVRFITYAWTYNIHEWSVPADERRY